MDWNRNNIQYIRAILLAIIEAKGDCVGFTVSGQCSMCPFANAAKRIDGSYISCVEFIAGSRYPWQLNGKDMDEFINSLYLEQAERLLADIEIEELLRSHNE